MLVCIFVPQRHLARIKASPGLMIIFRIQLVGLYYVKLALVLGLLDKRGITGCKPHHVFFNFGGRWHELLSVEQAIISEYHIRRFLPEFSVESSKVSELGRLI